MPTLGRPTAHNIRAVAKSTRLKATELFDIERSNRSAYSVFHGR